jgi:hypothetical protein
LPFERFFRAHASPAARECFERDGRIQVSRSWRAARADPTRADLPPLS